MIYTEGPQNYRITVFELECHADDYRTDNGQGFPDSTVPYELDIYEVYVS